MRLQVPIGTAKDMSVIDKKCTQPALGGLPEDRLPVVCMGGADIYQPGQPKALAIVDPFEAGSGKHFLQAYTIPSQKS